MSEPNTVLEPIAKGWNELTALVDSLEPDGLELTGSDGWAVKDHLAHVAAWEKSLIALFEGTDRAAAMGLSPADDDGTDAINEAIWKLHRAQTPEQALSYFRNTHAELIRLLQGMSDDDLQLTYNHYQPNQPRDPGDDRPALDWVAGNTWEHYAEHVEWIKAIRP